MPKQTLGIHSAHQVFTEDLQKDKDFLDYRAKSVENGFHTVVVQKGFEIDTTVNSDNIIKKFKEKT